MAFESRKKSQFRWNKSMYIKQIKIIKLISWATPVCIGSKLFNAYQDDDIYIWVSVNIQICR